MPTLPNLFTQRRKQRERIEADQRDREARLIRDRYEQEHRREQADREAHEARQRAEEESSHRQAIETQLRLRKEEDRRQRHEAEVQRQAAEDRMRAMEAAEHQRRQLEHEQQERDRRLAFQRQQRESQRQAQLRNTEPKALYNLRELIRMRYQLDVKIWKMRNVMRSNQKVVTKLMVESDAILQQIYDTVESWDERNFQGHPREWAVAVQIRDGLLNSRPRLWANNPPWNDELEQQTHDCVYF